MLESPIHHLLQVGSVIFASKDYVEKACLQNIILVDFGNIVLAPRAWFSDYMVAEVLGTFNDQIRLGTTRVKKLNDSEPFMPFGGIYALHSGGFGRKLFFVLGQCQDNPLLLLGQYSDNEPGEEANGNIQSAVTEISLIEENGKEDEPVEKGCGSVEDKTGEGFVSEQVKQEELKEESAQSNAVMDLDGNGVEENGVAPSGDPYKKVDSITQTSHSLTSGTEIIGDACSVWKIVMHEESNQYYYWNTETGETSWDVPKVLSQVAETASEQEVPLVREEMDGTPASTSASCNLNEELALYSNATAIAESGNAHLISEAKEKYEIGVQKENANEGYEDKSGDGRNLCYSLYGNEKKSGQNPVTSNIEDTSNQQLMGDEGHDRGAALSIHLLEHGQKLLQKLKELEKFSKHPQGNVWISKYIFEIEIRLSDFKSLSAYGTSLLPFWTHSEEKLRALENSMDSEISHFYKSAQQNEVGTGQVSYCEGDSSSLQNLGEESKVNEKGQVATPTFVKPHSITNIESLEGVWKEENDRSTSIDANIRQISPSVSPMQHLEAVAEGNLQEVDKTANPAGLISKYDSFPGDEMDMDVDMEVDDETTADHITPEESSCITHSLSQQNIQPNPSHTLKCPEGEYSVPPPDEDWIPPPPPDNEPVPPPPPDEPLASAYPLQPTYSETVQSFPYTEQYNLAYPVSVFEYYGPVITEAASTSYYGHTEGQRTADPQQPQYYETASNAYSEATSAIVNPVEPVVYHEFPNGTAPTGPIIISLESSGFYSQSGSVSYVDSGATDQVGSLKGLAECGGSMPTNLEAEPDASAVSSDTETKAVQIPSVSNTSQVTSTAFGGNVPVLVISASAAPPAPSTTTTKTQSKVVRSKKRAVAVAPTLRSNKKVSSLVDKWKAAKEELHEDEEDEPENAYEMLERKRQKQIEEWRAQQIASGEAKENANFQPLGADWRERVKRKRAQSTSNIVQTPPDKAPSEKQQPDLTELSRDLPSGWQAYWDESSKEVYYGNVVTSETTWTKPTR